MGKLRFHEGFQVRSSAQSWPVFLCIAGVVCTVLFSLLNPEPSQSLSGPERFVFWLAHAGGLLGLMQAAQILLMYIAPVRQFGAWPQIVLAGLIGALLFTPIALVLDQLFGLAAVTDDEAQSWRYRILDDFAAMAPPSVLTWVGLNAARHLRLPALGNAPGDATLTAFFGGGARAGRHGRRSSARASARPDAAKDGRSGANAACGPTVSRHTVLVACAPVPGA